VRQELRVPQEGRNGKNALTPVLRPSARPTADDRVDELSHPANRRPRRASRRKRPLEVHPARSVSKAPLPNPRGRATAAEAETPAAAVRQQLSRREREIVALLIAGRSVKEAAAALGLSPRTVEDYLVRLKRRFRQPRLLSLVAHLVKHGLDL